MGTHDYTIYSFINRNAAVYGRQTALSCGDRSWTHGGFKDRVDRLARGFRDAGLLQGDRVAVLSKNNLEYVLLFGAAARLGLVMVPLNWRLTEDEISFQLEDAAPKMLFTDQEYLDLAGRLFAHGPVYALEGDGPGAAPISSLMDNDGSGPDVSVGADDPFIILYTAAVEGRPRGAVLSHRNLLMENLNYISHWQVTARDVQLIMLPLFHVLGVSLILAVMQAGGRNVVMPGFDPDLALWHMREDQVTLFGEFPPMLETLMDRSEDVARDFASVRNVGWIENPAVIERFQAETNARFWVAFGQAETSCFVSCAPYDDRPGSAGIPSHMADMAVMDDDGRELAAGKTGEIVVRGPLVFQGYWNRERDTADAFSGGWHHTGDLGCFDEDGYLWYKGRTRKKELIKPGGENVYPAEVEKVLGEHPAVGEAVVFGVPDPKWGEAVRAVCRLNDKTAATEAELIDFVAGRIARYKKPKRIFFTHTFPRTGDGAIDRAWVKSEYGDV